MNKKFRALALGCMLMLSFTAYAQQPTIPSFDQLTPEQQAEIASKVAQQHAYNIRSGVVAKPADAEKPAVESVERWVNIGAKIGMAFAGAAKELGVAANEFLKTPAGMITVGLITYHYIGDDVIKLGAAMIVLFVGSIVSFALFRSAREVRVECNKDVRTIFGTHPKTLVVRSQPDVDYIVSAVISIVVTIAVFTLLVVTIG
jgi:hypothetical protein